MAKCFAGCVDCINTGVFRSCPFYGLVTLNAFITLLLLSTRNSPLLISRLEMCIKGAKL
jgi:hypothetical protein